MPDFNPSFPDVFGPEWLITRSQLTRVYAGGAARMLDLPSTDTETIEALRLSAVVNPLLIARVPTVIDVIEEGNELPAKRFLPHKCRPNGDDTINGWRTNTGASSNLFQAIDEDAVEWPGPAQFTWIENTNSFENYLCSFDVSPFEPGGAYENARIGFVELRAIQGANTGHRKMRTSIHIDGIEYQSAGGNLRVSHGFGVPWTYWWGELNPSTGLPWTPADIADFGISGNSRGKVRSQTATALHFPKLFALQLWVYVVPIENRVAVGVWRRPSELTDRLQNIETDAFVSMPDGTPGWSKQAAKSYLYYWRQSVSPALYGAVVADDVRWHGVYQDLGPGGEPPGIVYPLHHSGSSPPPPGVVASQPITHDNYGRPASAFEGNSRVGYGLVLVDNNGFPSVDSQPYRLDVTDIVVLKDAVGQRVTPPSTQSYIGVRLPIIPTARTSTGTAVLRVTVHRVSDDVQIGGTFEITEEAARALPGGATVAGVEGIGSIRYVSGFLSSGATLQGGTTYEIRISVTGGKWLAFAPDASLGIEASFGGAANSAVIDGVLTERDLSVNLIRQPDAPTGVTASVVDAAITTFAGGITTVEHVQVSWDEPATPLGLNFARYEVERRLDGGPWQRVANPVGEAVTSWLDREVPRDTAADYRIRSVALDGRISQWAESSGTATPTAPGAILILTSNHRPDLEVVHLFDPESSYPVLSNEADETVAIHGSDHQVVFMEAEDRGVGWRTGITVEQVTLVGKAGLRAFDPLLRLVRSVEIPYVCAMDHQGTRILGHVTVSEPHQRHPQIYTAQIDVIPTHGEPVPVEVQAVAQEDQTLSASGWVEAVGSASVSQQWQTLAASGTIT